MEPKTYENKIVQLTFKLMVPTDLNQCYLYSSCL